MEDSASQPNDTSLKEEGELSDDDEVNGTNPVQEISKDDKVEQRPTTAYKKHHSSSPQYSKNRYVSNKRKRPDNSRVGGYSSPSGRRDLGPYFNKRRHLIGNNNNSNNNINGPRCGPDGIPLKNCSDLGPANIGGISGGYWAPPLGVIPSGPPRILPLSIHPWDQVHHHHHPGSQPPSRGPLPPGISPAGPGNVIGQPGGRPLPFGPWSDGRRGPQTSRSNFPYWEKKRYLRKQSGSQFLCDNQAPGLKDDGDYEDLLEKYRNIQEQLASLREEEDRAAIGQSDLNSTDENTNNGMSQQTQYNPKNGSYRTVTISHRCSQSPGDNSPTTKRSDAADSTDATHGSENSKSDKKMKEEDEELEELRRIALASADSNKPKPKPKSTTSLLKHDKSMPKTPSIRHSRSFSNSFSSRLARSARKREPSVLRDRISSSSATRKKVHLACRHQSDRSRRSKLAVDRKKQELADGQRRDICRILDEEDPIEQLEKLAKFVWDRKKDLPNFRISRGKSPSSKKSDNKDVKASKLLQDNYEEVAMDIDSDDGTTTVSEIEDIKIDMPRREQVLFNPAFSLKLEWSDHPKGWLKLPPPPPPPIPPSDSLHKTSAVSATQPLYLPVLSQPLLPPSTGVNLTPCMPPPPPPPLPDEPYPEAEKPPEPPYDEDEEEEKLLRAQLLQSISKRRKETSSGNIQQPVQQINSLKEDSQSSSRSQSPFHLEKIEQERKKPYYPPKVMPKHPSVVINLAEDSSDSDTETQTDSDAPQPLAMLSGLDQFLKDARKSVETQVEKNSVPDAKQLTMAEKELATAERLKDLKKQVVDLQAADAGFRQMEEKYVAQRKQMIQDQAQMKILVTQASKFLTNLKSAEKRCEVLKENLKKSEKLVKVNQQQVTKVKAEVQRVKSRLQQNEASVLQLENNLLQIGQRLYGSRYQPTTIAVDSAGNRQELPLLSTKLKKPNVLTANHMSNNTNSSSTQKKKNVEDIAKEKKRLELMQLEYAEKLRQLQIQAQKKAAAAAAATSKPQPLPRLEKIALDCTDEPEFNDQSQNAKPVVPMRRKSLITLNSNMKPEIVQNKENVQFDLNVTHLPAETEEDCFKMPETSQLTSLRKVLHEKMQGFLKSPHSKVNSTESFNLLLPPIQTVSGLKIDVPPVCNDKSNLPVINCFKPYKSPLLHFRSYRFSPFFRTKENMSLTCPSFSHKLNPKKLMCNYDLLGTCNDQECTCQHTKDYTMSKTEILQDVVSYTPGLAGATEDLPSEKLVSLINSYVENIVNQNQGRMTTDELCLLQVSKVNEYASHVAPHTMFFKRRSCKPSQKNQTDNLDDIYSVSNSENHTIFQKSQLASEPETIWEEVVDEQDIRYFASSDNAAAIDDLESALLQDPNNDQLWLKLANKKLNSWESDRLDQALNVLARGLETNKQSPFLWQRYLQLYSQHQDSQNDLIIMCQTAIQNAPTYSMWWLYLNKVQNYFEKTKLCKEILQFLKKQETNEKVSHYITEIIIYQVGLMVITNRYKTGLLFLKNLLQTPSNEDKDLILKLCPADKCLLWLCYIHLYEFHQLPDQLYDPCGSLPDKLIAKTILINWESDHHQLHCQMNFLVDLFNEALDSCVDDQQINAEHHAIASILYSNLFNLFRSQAKWEEAVKLCLQVVNKWPGLEDVWLSMAQLHYVSGDKAAAKRVFIDALETGPYSARLYLYAAMLEMAGDDHDQALEYLEEAAVNCFDITTRDPRCDPNILYCCLLDQTLPFGYKTPEYCDKINPEVLQKNQIYLWLAYCLLLELQGDNAQAIETYETALSTVDLTGDIVQIWQHYLRFQIRQLSPEGFTSLGSKLPDLVIRCLTSLPAKTELRHWPGHFWLNYEHHNSIIDLYISCLSKEQQFIAYDTFIAIMPNNTDLILRAFDAAVAVGDFCRAFSLCQTGIHEKLPSIHFWVKVTSLAIEKGGGNEMRLDNLDYSDYCPHLYCYLHNVSDDMPYGLLQVQQLFMKAVRVLPYAVSLWKHFLFFEVTLGAEANVLQIIRRCKELDVNILGFVKTISG